LAVQTADYWFVGPDNGVLSWALAKEQIKTVRALENEEYFLQPVSGTFHGRDIFAPVAAHLSRGLAIRKLGPAREDFVRLAWPEPRRPGDRIEGEVVYVDRYGNAITNIAAGLLRSLGPAAVHLWLRGRRLCPVAAYYQAVPPGQPVAVPGSSGFLEIAVHGASAAHRHGLRVGQRVTVRAARVTGQSAG
jgi:S-adenosylmethionine hydrolase